MKQLHWRWLFWVVWEWSLIGLALLVCYFYLWTIPLSIIIIGCRQQALLVLGHEVVHSTSGALVWAARLLCFWPVCADYDGYKRQHLQHHAHIGQTIDYEVRQRAGWSWYWTGLTPWKKAELIAMDLVGLGIPFSLALLRWVEDGYSITRALFTVTWVVVLWSAVWWMPLLWFWSLLTVSAAAIRARMWREHWDMPEGETHEYVAKLWERWVYLPHGIWKHLDHHKAGNWNTPCWDLPTPSSTSIKETQQ